MASDLLPSVNRYLERLPYGVDSHAQCTVKASVYRDALAAKDLDAALEALPAKVRELVENPAPVSAWVNEVHSNVVMIAIRDLHFAAGAAGLAEYAEWTRQRNVRLLTRPLYRALFLVLSPQRLVRGVERRWAAFRRGTSVETTSAAPNSIVLRVHFPLNLYEETALTGLRAALTAALEAAGARDVETKLLEANERDARYAAHWRGDV